MNSLQNKRFINSLPYKNLEMKTIFKNIYNF